MVIRPVDSMPSVEHRPGESIEPQSESIEPQRHHITTGIITTGCDLLAWYRSRVADLVHVITGTDRRCYEVDGDQAGRRGIIITGRELLTWFTSSMEPRPG
jgi:hypothetical protein